MRFVCEFRHMGFDIYSVELVGQGMLNVPVKRSTYIHFSQVFWVPEADVDLLRETASGTLEVP